MIIHTGNATWPEHSKEIDQVYKCGSNKCIVAD